MRPAMQKYQTAAAERREIISRNRSRRISGMDPLPVPPQPERPALVLANDANGDYIAAWPTETEAREWLAENGIIGARVYRAPAAW